MLVLGNPHGSPHEPVVRQAAEGLAERLEPVAHGRERRLARRARREQRRGEFLDVLVGHLLRPGRLPGASRRLPLSGELAGGADAAGVVAALPLQVARTGAPVTFQTVAQQASVSRSWLYTQPDIRAEIDRLRTTTRPATEPSVPARQRSSEASPHRRLEAANSRNRQLADENSRLRRQLAEALGRLRLADAREPDKSAPASRSSVTIGPC
ncbi:DUF6262 family protein [Nonomuraea jabiensis]|uniref:DUF6262 family protein n=1 Tax=Nonomuraea jabiensis TaxID=882448 RepID=UPI0036CC6F7A